VFLEREVRAQGLKPRAKQNSYQSGEPLRHPKIKVSPSSSAACSSRAAYAFVLDHSSSVSLRPGYRTFFRKP
jgi:hypothetical protein